MQLVDEGKVDLHKPIAEYLDSLPTDWRMITLSQLLGHTAGLPYIEDDFTDGLVGNKGEETACSGRSSRRYLCNLSRGNVLTTTQLIIY